MSRRTIGLALAGLLILAILIYQIPAVNSRLAWRLDLARVALINLVNPVGGVPTPQQLAQPEIIVVNEDPTATPTAAPTPTSGPTPTALPASASIDTPEVEYQTPNNCGPATLSLYLRFYGWEGDQTTISDVIKPVTADRNVNVDELDYYVRTRAGWLNTIFRVGGDLDLLKAFVAAGIPVMVEKGEIIEADYWPNDDNWAGHYALVTGYDDATQTFTFQDTFRGADQQMGYKQFDEFWQQFNRLYTLVYLPEQEATVQSILGERWDVDASRQIALQTAEAEIQADPEDAYAWFNKGMLHVNYGQWAEAARAFDAARSIGLPQRMLRYQFGPFWAYHRTGQIEELLVLTEYALQRTDVSEEALVWRAYGLAAQGQRADAEALLYRAYEANPNSSYVELAMNDFGIRP